MSSFLSGIGTSLGKVTGRALGIVLAVLILGVSGYWAYNSIFSASSPEPSLSAEDSVSVAPPSLPVFPQEEIRSTSPSGDVTTRQTSSPEQTRGTVTITDTTKTDSSGSATGLVIKTQEQWFPQWNRVPPVKRIGGTGAVVWTPAEQPFLNWNPSFLLGGSVTTEAPGAFVGMSLITVADRIHIGPFAHLSPSQPMKSSVGAAVGTDIRRNLSLMAGVDHRRDPILALTYRF